MSPPHRRRPHSHRRCRHIIVFGIFMLSSSSSSSSCCLCSRCHQRERSLRRHRCRHHCHCRRCFVVVTVSPLSLHCHGHCVVASPSHRRVSITCAMLCHSVIATAVAATHSHPSSLSAVVVACVSQHPSVCVIVFTCVQDLRWLRQLRSLRR